MARRTLRELGAGGDKHNLSEYVGMRLRLYRIVKSDSRQYGPGMEIVADVYDDKTGELVALLSRIVTFAAPVIRDLSYVTGGANYWEQTDGDTLDVTVKKVGQAYVVEDVPELM